MSNTDLTVTPAYGRDYTSAAAVLADWAAGKDFQVAGGGPYVNLEDAQRHDVGVSIRYDRMRKKVVARVRTAIARRGGS